MRVEGDARSSYRHTFIAWRDRDRPIVNGLLGVVAPQHMIACRQLLQSKQISRVNFDGVLKFPGGLGPAPLPAVNRPRETKNIGVVWKTPLRELKLRTRALVVVQTLIEIPAVSVMQLVRVGLNFLRSSQGSFGQVQSLRCVIKLEPIKSYVRLAGAAISE